MALSDYFLSMRLTVPLLSFAFLFEYFVPGGVELGQNENKNNNMCQEYHANPPVIIGVFKLMI